MSITSKKYTFDIAANGSVRMPIVGAFFRILSALGPVDVVTEAVNLESLGVGDGFKDKPFGWLTLKDRSGAVNTVSFVVSDEEFLNAPAVSTAISSNKSPQVAGIAHTAPAVGVASGQLLAANSARQYLMVQNQDAAATIWLRFGATAATKAAPCVKLGPGATWEWDSVGLTQAVQAIADIATANVTVLEG